jgi:hypothetical protein
MRECEVLAASLLWRVTTHRDGTLQEGELPALSSTRRNGSLLIMAVVM